MKPQNPTTILAHDGVVILPTDTLYGMCASAHSKKAVARIYDIKGRDENKPFIILIDSVTQLSTFGISLTKEQKMFLEHIWPNPVTVILPVPAKKHTYLHRGTNALAFRIPKSQKLRDLLKKTGPLVAPSANPQGLKPAETIREAKAYFGKLIDLYIAGGRKVGTPSTILKLSHTGAYEIVRQGRFIVR